MRTDRPIRIVSGGQTGADRAALDAALELGVEIGGSIPAGRTAEDGPVPTRYSGLIETSSCKPSVRTILNVLASDATLIVCRGPLRGGTRLTRIAAAKLHRPHILIDRRTLTARRAAFIVRRWLERARPETLNVAGPRLSEEPSIYRDTFLLLKEVFQTRTRARVKGPRPRSSPIFKPYGTRGTPKTE
ncbi:MAG: YpsA SLOG family protein [Pyrinomonadaceae bacterium]